MMNRAYKFRIYPTDAQEILLSKTFGCCRFIYNRMLDDKICEYRETGKMKRTTPAMYKKEFPWLKEVDSLALANVQLHLESAYKKFFREPKTGFPKFKSKHKSRQSYTTNVVKGNIRLFENRLKLPKLGEVRIKVHREINEGFRLKSVTISRESTGKYFASLLYESTECESQAVCKKTEDMKILGIDYAMDGMAVFSDERKCEYPKFFRESEEKLAKEQRKLSRCRRGSSNYQKQKRKVALCHEKIRNQRKDYHHKLSHQITREYDAVSVEDLDMKAMSTSLHFGKSVMDNGYGMFRDMLVYKLREQGKELIKIDRFFPSSKKCSVCGAVKKELKLSERIYRCTCGSELDRDVNAAINIREEGRRILMARGCA